MRHVRFIKFVKHVCKHSLAAVGERHTHEMADCQQVIVEQSNAMNWISISILND